MPLKSLRVFVSSPGDVAEERLIARRVIGRLEAQFGDVLHLEPLFWEHEPLLATASFQEQVPRTSEADIAIVILWSRIGTALPGHIQRPDGSAYSSGTEFEFEDAVDGFRRNGKPELLVYRKTAPPTWPADDALAAQRVAQKVALDEFIDKWFVDRESGGVHGGLPFLRIARGLRGAARSAPDADHRANPGNARAGPAGRESVAQGFPVPGTRNLRPRACADLLRPHGRRGQRADEAAPAGRARYGVRADHGHERRRQVVARSRRRAAVDAASRRARTRARVALRVLSPERRSWRPRLGPHRGPGSTVGGAGLARLRRGRARGIPRRRCCKRRWAFAEQVVARLAGELPSRARRRPAGGDFFRRSDRPATARVLRGGTRRARAQQAASGSWRRCAAISIRD